MSFLEENVAVHSYLRRKMETFYSQVISSVEVHLEAK